MRATARSAILIATAALHLTISLIGPTGHEWLGCAHGVGVGGGIATTTVAAGGDGGDACGGAGDGACGTIEAAAAGNRGGSTSIGGCEGGASARSGGEWCVLCWHPRWSPMERRARVELEVRLEPGTPAMAEGVRASNPDEGPHAPRGPPGVGDARPIG